MLARTIWLSVDPYMRGRISRARNYAKGVEIGERMQGGGVGEVVHSNNPDFAPGTIVESRAFGWQEYAVLGAKGTRRLDPALAPIQSALSRSEEHTSELQSLMRNSYAVFCLKKKTTTRNHIQVIY